MQRPTSVTVFGILNILFAALGMLSVLLLAALFTVVGSSTNNPVVRLIHESSAYAAWLVVSIILGMIAAAALLAAGIGLLNLKSWARIVSIVYAIYALVSVPVSQLVNYFFLVRPLFEQAGHQQQPQVVGAAFGALGGSIGGCFGLVYPILLLVFMTRPNVVAAFKTPETAR
jgi:hypothetical protein